MSQSNSPQSVSIPLRIARLFRFRLLTLFVAMSLIAGWLAWKFHREPISPQNIGQVRKLSEIHCSEIYKLIYSPDRNRLALVAWERPVDIRESITLWPVRTIGADRKLIDRALALHAAAAAARRRRRLTIEYGVDEFAVVITGRHGWRRERGELLGRKQEVRRVHVRKNERSLRPDPY
jgi:hypothetical protein